MDPPSKAFKKAVKFGSIAVIGMFAGHRTALIQTESSANSYYGFKEALKSIPNAKFIISAGICYAFERKECKIGDIIVSDKISAFNALEYDTEGRIINRGGAAQINQTLKDSFCRNLMYNFEVSTTGRTAKVHCGTFISYTALIDNKDMRDKLKNAEPSAIGGEKEGGELLRLKLSKEVEGVIMIKSVVDYGEGGRLTAKDWYYTASLAAINYAHSKLLERPIGKFLGFD